MYAKKSYIDIIFAEFFNALLKESKLMNIWPFVLIVNKRLKNEPIFI